MKFIITLLLLMMMALAFAQEDVIEVPTPDSEELQAPADEEDNPPAGEAVIYDESYEE